VSRSMWWCWWSWWINVKMMSLIIRNVVKVVLGHRVLCIEKGREKIQLAFWIGRRDKRSDPLTRKMMSVVL
jgi:hypothetical protein